MAESPCGIVILSDRGTVYSGRVPRSFQEVFDQAEELADWFEEHGPSPESQRPVAEYYLDYIAEVRHSARVEIAEAVVAARKAGASWSQVAEVVGTSAAEAEQRFNPAVEQARTLSPAVESPVPGL